MKLVAGLGNPGPRYAESRHNIGFMVVDELARRWHTDVARYDRHFQGQIGQANRGTEVVLLLKPATFMNLSGQSVAAVARYYKLVCGDLLVVYDDLDLPVGTLRLRASGSAGGHKGLSDVIRHLSTSDVPRLRLGIGKVHRSGTTEHVLGRFAPDEQPAIHDAIAAAADAVACWLTSGLEAAMNAFNRKRGEDSPGNTPANGPRPEGESS